MKKLLHHIIGWVFVCSAIGCVSAPPVAPDISSAVTNDEGLVRIENSRFDDVWILPNFDLLSYDSVIVAPPTITYEHARPDNELTSRQTELMTRYFREALEETFAENYRLVSEPSVRTLRVHANIVDLNVNVPTEPPMFGRSRVFTASSGEMTLSAEVFDANSGELLARVIDREAPRTYWHEVTSISEWADVRQAFYFWSGIAKRRMDELAELRTGG